MKKIELIELRELEGVSEEETGCFSVVVDSSLPTLVIVSAIHGNEPVGVNVIYEKALQLSKLKPSLNYKFVVGNIKGYEEDKRFVETDLNRSFKVENATSYEEKRADTILNFIKDGDALIDLHQTQEQSLSPFIIFNYTDDNYQFASQVNIELPMVSFKTPSFSDQGKGTSSSFNLFGKPSCTVELGTKGISEYQIDLGLSLIKKAENALMNKPAEVKAHDLYTFSKTVFNKENNFELVPGLKNFSRISKGEYLYRDNLTDKKYYSEINGVLLVPKYGDNSKNSNELVRVLKKCKKDDL